MVDGDMLDIRIYISLQYLFGNAHMSSHNFHIGIIQPVCAFQNMNRNADFSDIMQHSPGFDFLNIVFIHAQQTGHDAGYASCGNSMNYRLAASEIYREDNHLYIPVHLFLAKRRVAENIIKHFIGINVFKNIVNIYTGCQKHIHNIIVVFYVAILIDVILETLSIAAVQRKNISPVAQRYELCQQFMLRIFKML